MAWNGTALNTAAAAMTAAYPYLSIHTTGGVTISTGESTAPRIAAAWSAPSAGVVSCTAKAFTGGAASGPAIRVGYWSAATAGTYGGGSLLTGDQAFNAAGAYTVNSITETGSAT